MTETIAKAESPESELLKNAPSRAGSFKPDWLTVAALGLMAMCMVSFDHEALGHGGVCLLLGGHIHLLTTSLFRCDVRSIWIDPAGPAMNLFIGLLALIARTLVPLRFSKARLFLILVTAFSLFWEAGYLILAMLRQNGDLYSFARDMLGNVTLVERLIAVALGLVLYRATSRLTSRALLTIGSSARASRAVARTAWLAATLGIVLATGAGKWRGLSDAVMEIGLASFPLLLIPHDKHEQPHSPSSPAIARSYPLIALSLIVLAVFVATLGRGIS